MAERVGFEPSFFNTINTLGGANWHIKPLIFDTGDELHVLLDV
jgi:hypothetical protein